MIQRLGEQMGINWERAIIAAFAAALLGLVYAYGVHQLYREDPDNPFTALLVVFGVTATLLAGAIIIPIQWIVTFAVLFGITGLPQMIGSMVRENRKRRQILDEARKHIGETLR